MNVSELIEQLKEFHGDLKVYVRMQDPLCEADYWEITNQDICGGDVRDPKTEKEYPAVLIGDDRA